MSQLLLVVLAFVSISTQSYANDLVTHIFGKVEPNYFALKDRPIDDPNLLYFLEFKLKDGRVYSTGVPRRELMPIVKHLGLNKPEDLSMKSFESSYADPETALERFRLDIEHGGSYVPPAPDQFFDQLAERLVGDSSEGNCPHIYSDYDSDTRFRSFRSAFSDNGNLDIDWFVAFNKKVRKASHGEMSIRFATKTEIQRFKNDPISEYVMLMKGNKPAAIFSLAPASNGFGCSKDPKYFDLQEKQAGGIEVHESGSSLRPSHVVR